VSEILKSVIAYAIGAGDVFRDLAVKYARDVPKEYKLFFLRFIKNSALKKKIRHIGVSIAIGSLFACFGIMQKTVR
jgi:hypothetical protein